MKVLLADPKPYIRYGLAVLMEEQPDIVVVGEVDSPDELLAKLRQTQPDLILIGAELLSKDLDSLLPEVRKIYPPLKIIILSGGSSLPENILSTAANGLIRKGDAPDLVLKTIRRIYQQKQRVHFDPPENQIPI